MIDIKIIESFIIPLIYFFFFFAAFIIIILMLMRFRQLSNYQQRIVKALNPTQADDTHAFFSSSKHFFNQFMENLNKFFLQINLLGGIKTEKLFERLANAGWRYKRASALFVLAKIMIVLVCSLTAVLINYHFLLPRFSIDQPIILFIIGIILGNRIVESFVNRSIKKYRVNIKKALPDALDLMLICFAAGYSNEKALAKISKGLSNNYPELSQEFEITATELRILPDRKTAWKNFANRTELSEINAIVLALQQNDKYGTPLEKTLRVQIDLFRRNRIARAEYRASRIPVLLTIPLVAFFVPVLFVVILSPAIIRVLDIIN